MPATNVIALLRWIKWFWLWRWLMTWTDPCGKRGIHWDRQPGFAILGGERKTEMAASRTACRNLCLRETSFLCRSFAYLYQASTCYLYPMTSARAGSSFARLPGYVFEEWTCVTGNLCFHIWMIGQIHIFLYIYMLKLRFSLVEVRIELGTLRPYY
jgi:hypothetical protein